MINIVDVILILFLLIVAFVGYKRGFIKTLFRFASFFVAIILAFSLYKPVAAYLKDNTGIDEWISEKITGKYEEISESENANSEVTDEEKKELTLEQTIQNLPENLKQMAGLDEIKTEAKQTLSEKVTGIALNLISIIGIYVIVKLALGIACFILDGVMKIPVLKQCNEILGLLLGIITGVLQVYIIFGIVTFLSSIISMEVITTSIKASLIAGMLYENNLLIALIF